MNKPKLAFTPETVRVKIEDLIPVRIPDDLEKRVKRYGSILSSLSETDVVEPLVIFPLKGSPGKYVVLDGNLRFHVLKKVGAEDVVCVVATEDESFIYNSRISRLAPIQEHRMIAKAVNNGVPVERVATALNLSVAYIKDTLDLLHGLHAETIQLLETRKIPHASINILKRVTHVRQIAMAELMVSANNFGSPYAQALLASTPVEMLVDKEKPAKVGNLSEEDAGRLREEMQTLESEYRAIEDSYGDNILKLTAAKGYLKSLLGNARVVRWLNQKNREILEQFEVIVASEAL